MSEYSVKPPKSMIPTFLGGIALFALFGALTLYVLNSRPVGQDYDTKRGVERLTKRQKLNADEQQLLATYGVVNAPNGVYHIPIEKAVELTLADLKNKPVKASAVPLPPVLPAGPQAPIPKQK
jgi:hypothetical protein